MGVSPGKVHSQIRFQRGGLDLRWRAAPARVGQGHTHHPRARTIDLCHNGRSGFLWNFVPAIVVSEDNPSRLHQFKPAHPK